MEGRFSDKCFSPELHCLLRLAQRPWSKSGSLGLQISEGPAMEPKSGLKGSNTLYHHQHRRVIEKNHHRCHRDSGAGERERETETHKSSFGQIDGMTDA